MVVATRPTEQGADMRQVVTMTKDKTTKNTVRYGSTTQSILPVVYINKIAFEGTAPETISVTIEG